MAAEAKLKVTADTSQAQRELSSLDKALDGIKTVAGFAIAALAGRAAINAIGDFIGAAAEAETNLNAVATALSRMGDLSQESLDDVSAFANELSRTTGITDDAALEAFKLASAFGVTREQAKEMVTAATELSAATGKELSASVQILGKSLDGTAGALKDFGPEMRNLTADQLKAGAAARTLIDTLGGTAAAQLQTFSGSVTSTSNAFGELAESLGNIAVKNPVVIAAIQKVGDLVRGFTGFIDNNSESIRSLLNDGIIALAKGLAALKRPIQFAIDTFRAIFETSLVVAGGFVQIASAAAEFKIVNDAIKVVGLGLVELARLSVDTGGVIAAGIEGLFELVGVKPPTGLSETFAELSLKVKGLDDVIAGANIPQAMDDATAAIADFQLKGSDAFAKASDAIGTASGGLATFADDLENLPDTKEIEIRPNIGKVQDIVVGIVTDPKVIAEYEKQNKEAAEKSGIRLSSALGVAIHGFKNDSEAALSEFGRRAAELGSATASAFFGNIAGGKEGAKKAVAGIGGAIANAIVPGLGGPVQQALDLLGSDPEAFKGMIDGFVKGIPVIIDNIVANIPVLVQTLAENSGEIITALASASPRIAVALAQSMPIVAQALLDELAEGFGFQIDKFNQSITHFQNSVFAASQQFSAGFKNAVGSFTAGIKAGVPDIMSEFKDQVSEAGKLLINGLVSGAQQVVDAITPDFSGIGGSGGIVDDSVPILGGLASGGTIPGGFPDDSFLAGLTSGETVVPKDDVEDDRSFRSEQRSQAGVMNALLSQILQAVQQPQNLQTSIELDGNKLAEAMLGLSRRNARIA